MELNQKYGHLEVKPVSSMFANNNNRPAIDGVESKKIREIIKLVTTPEVLYNPKYKSLWCVYSLVDIMNKSMLGVEFKYGPWSVQSGKSRSVYYYFFIRKEKSISNSNKITYWTREGVFASGGPVFLAHAMQRVGYVVGLTAYG